MNVLVALVLYMVIYGTWGETTMPISKLKNGVVTDSVGYFIGFRNGDNIKQIDGKNIKKLEDVPLALILHDKKGTITVTRNGADTTFPIPSGTIRLMVKHKTTPVIPRLKAIVDSVFPKSIAASLGFQQGDSIISVNGISMQYASDFNDYRDAHFTEPMAVAFARNGKIDTFHAVIPKDSAFGMRMDNPRNYTEHLTYTPVKAVGRGLKATINKFKIYIAQFKLLGSDEVKVSENMGGFYSMGKLYPEEFDWYSFLSLTAFISIALAFMNLLPIPGLDGGYVIFLLFEMVTGKKVSEKVMERATTVGLILILALMVYVNGLDILRIFKK